jgi:hypothetical protein
MIHIRQLPASGIDILAAAATKTHSPEAFQVFHKDLH